VSNDFVSHQKFETADADWRKADAALAKAKAALGAEQSQLGVLAASRVEAVTKVDEAQATLAVVQNDLDNTVIRSPIAGVVGNRGVQAGQYVKAGSTLLSIVPLPNVYVVANFKETQLARMRPGQPVEITVDAYPDQKLSGQVESFAPASGSQFSLLPPENATGNFTKIVQRVPVRIAVPANSALAGLIRPGLSVTASVDTHGAGSGLAQSTVVGSVFGAIRAATQSSSAK
jgi:membrane fusion protein (multidrug efflux system)